MIIAYILCTRRPINHDQSRKRRKVEVRKKTEIDKSKAS